MNDDDHIMIKVKKLCPMCIMHVGTIPPKQLKLCPVHKAGKPVVYESINHNKKITDDKHNM